MTDKLLDIADCGLVLPLFKTRPECELCAVCSGIHIKYSNHSQGHFTGQSEVTCVLHPSLSCLPSLFNLEVVRQPISDDDKYKWNITFAAVALCVYYKQEQPRGSIVEPQGLHQDCLNSLSYNVLMTPIISAYV